MLGEFGLAANLVEEEVLKRRPEFLALNPAGMTPVLVEEDSIVCGPLVIAEYLEETKGESNNSHGLMPSDPKARAEVRRIANWFNEKFYAEVSELLVREKILKRRLSKAEGGGPPDSEALRAAQTNIRYHLKYIGWLLKTRSWLAGDRLTYADLAAASHLSAIDYLGDVPWDEDEAVKNWYARIKSRPSFRPLLADIVPGLPASKDYTNLDF